MNPDLQVMPGAGHAMSVIHPGPAALRVRFRQGVLIGPYGFPEWLLYARAVVELPPPIAELTADEQRVFDVLTANRVTRGADPLWPAAQAGGATPTPPGWCWARLPVTADGEPRRTVLVPIELHAAFRHGGATRTLPTGRPGPGVRTDPGAVPVPPRPGVPVPGQVLSQIEDLLGYELPGAYRRYLLECNGAGPAEPGVLAVAGLVADQPLFGLARDDALQDVGFAPQWLADRFTPEFLPVGFVQGGLLALRVAGQDAGSVWWLDDDDPRDDDRFGPAEICARLLRRCADDWDGFWTGLHRSAAVLLEVADDLVTDGQARVVRPEFAGEALPAKLRPYTI
ncbi:SMI1/KNR4 family protein [Actinoplanes sp. NPDC020271]|uniref:SMI1/KNR4 family protein n=1 Tax=Actinoplanes sp. NPDC020271 TaxID=3363896 RepID=UPI0037A60634